MAQHIIMSTQPNGGSTLAQADTPHFSDAEHPDGWRGMALQDAGILMFTFDIAADATEYPLHASEDAWLAYVASGAGTLYAADEHGHKSDGMRYTEGDYITFRPNCLHGWQSDGSPSRIVFTKISQ